MVDTSSNGIAVLICQRTPSRHDGGLSAKQPHRQLPLLNPYPAVITMPYSQDQQNPIPTFAAALQAETVNKLKALAALASP